MPKKYRLPAAILTAWTISLVVFSGFGSHLARADEVYTFVIKKQEEKSKSSWNLADWLDTRDRMRLMDLWLALHTPTPYEFYAGADYFLPSSNSSTPGAHARVYGAAYVSIFGLGLERDFGQPTDLTALLLLRIFGFHSQGTNITLQGGVRSLGDPVSAQSGLFGAEATIYLARVFGVEGLFRHYFDSTPPASGMTVSGHDRWQGGVFIDFTFLRVYGDYFSEPAGPDSASGSGVNLGTRIYF